jgi:hypothetical protein
MMNVVRLVMRVIPAKIGLVALADIIASSADWTAAVLAYDPAAAVLSWLR